MLEAKRRTNGRRIPNLSSYIADPQSRQRSLLINPKPTPSPLNSKTRPITRIHLVFILVFASILCYIIYRSRSSSTPLVVDFSNPTTTDVAQHSTALLLDSKHESISTDDVILKFESNNAMSAITDRETALSFTKEDCSVKSECGRCWLNDNLGLILQISSIIPIPSNALDPIYSNLNLLAYWITIRAVNDDSKKSIQKCEAKEITIYISIIDVHSESVGGLAIPDTTSQCGWKYKWIVSRPGTFTVNAYLLYFRGYLDFNAEQCRYQKNMEFRVDSDSDGDGDGDGNGDIDGDSLILDKLPPKWRFYGEIEGCCEWCNRMNGKCKSWTSGSENKCILFTESPDDVGSRMISQRRNGWTSGMYRGEAQQWYLGSLLNIQPNGCHHTKLDLIYNSGQTMQVLMESFDSTQSALQNDNDDDNGINVDALCPSNHVLGRWVSIEGEHRKCDSTPFDSWCWIQRRFPRVPFRWRPYQCRFMQRSPSEAQQCLVSRERNRIAVGGDSLIRLFSLEMVRYIMGDPMPKANDVENWSYSKHYAVGDTQLWFMGYDHKIDDVSFMKEFIVSPENEDKPNVFIHNFQVIHKIWHLNVTQFMEVMRGYKEAANLLFEEHYGPKGEGRWPIRMVFEAPLLVSEREYHDTADRAIIYNDIIRDILEPDGWVVIPVLEISRSRMYDSTNPKDGVVDGMHMSSNILIEIARVTVDMLCRFDLSQHGTNDRFDLPYTSPP